MQLVLMISSGGDAASRLSIPKRTRDSGFQGIMANLSTVPIRRVGGWL
jgi:hypothetical protein